MPRSSFDFDRGVTQWRMEPINGSTRAGLWAFTLGYDGEVPRYEDVAFGDYFQTSQQLDLTNVALIRCHVNIKQPKTLPNREDISRDFELIGETIDSPGNKVIIARGMTVADINKSVLVSGCANAANNAILKLVGQADSITAFVDKAIVSETARSNISAIILGARWKFSLLIDNVEYARCIQSDRETGFYRDDLILHCSKLTGNHTVSFRITLIEQSPTNTYDFFLGPPRTGLVFWVKGDAGLEWVPASPFDTSTAWRDQSGLGQDLDVTPTHGGSIAPYVHLDSIDGIPCISFPAGATESWLARTQNMLDTNSNPITTGPRTVMAVMLPKSGAFNVTGGPVICFKQASPEITCLFDTESNVDPDGAYAFTKRWRGDIGTANQFTPVLGGPGGTYDNVPTFAEWQFGTSPAIAFRINNVPTTVAPTTRSVGTAVSETGFIVGCGAELLEFSFMGAIAEVIVWDYDLATNPTAHQQAINYIAARYPSLGL